MPELLSLAGVARKTANVVRSVVFGLPGLGREVVQAILKQDLPVVIGVTILSSALVVSANLLVDVLHAALDPRVRE